VSIPNITLGAGVLDAVVAHARSASPAECCGILVGRPGTIVEILEAVRARNLATSPNRFLLDPKDHIAALRSTRATGLQVVGFYHSHPHSTPAPSATDLAEASYDDHLHLIVSLLPPAPQARLYRVDGRRFIETSFEVAIP
jgi:proteasome lid subunit RPN8/RPN11